MSLAFSLCGVILAPFVAYLFFDGWPAVIFVGSIYFLMLLGAVIRGFSEPISIKKASRNVCFDEVATPYSDTHSAWRCEIDIRVQPQPINAGSTGHLQVNTRMQNSFDLPSDECDEEILDVDDMAVPEVVREHGRRFRNPAKYAMNLGNDEYLLFGEDGELLDGVYLKD